MKMESVDRFFKKGLSVSYIVAPVIILFIWWRGCERIEKRFMAKCTLEKTLSFEGVVSGYKTDIFSEESTFLLNDTIRITIPRNSKEVSLHDGDTVKK